MSFFKEKSHCLSKFFRARISGSFTVESAVIIPIFTFITIALIAMGFYVRNTVVAKSLCLKSAIELERITAMNPESDYLLRASEKLRAGLCNQGIFVRNVHANVTKDTGGKIIVSASADSSFVLPMFGHIGSVSVQEKADIHNPATNMRRWHALGMLTGR